MEQNAISGEISVTVTRRQDKYRLLVDFGAEIAQTMADEPQSLGDGRFPRAMTWYCRSP